MDDIVNRTLSNASQQILRAGGSAQVNGDPETIRTSDLQIRNLPLYPAELRGLDWPDNWPDGCSQSSLKQPARCGKPAFVMG